MSEAVFECVVSADLFRRAQLCVSKEETRYYLNGVHVSPSAEGGAILAATDGSMLICLHDPDAHVVGEGIIQLDKQMVRALPVSGVLLEKRLLAIRELSGRRGRAFVVDQPRSKADAEARQEIVALSVLDDPDKRVRAAQFGPLLIDGTFPDWRRLMPTTLAPGAPCPVFSQQKLATLIQALGSKHESQVNITPTGEAPRNSPLLITSFYMLVQGFAILMPTRNEPKVATVPAWIAAPPMAEAA